MSSISCSLMYFHLPPFALSLDTSLPLYVAMPRLPGSIMISGCDFWLGGFVASGTRRCRGPVYGSVRIRDEHGGGEGGRATMKSQGSMVGWRDSITLTARPSHPC